MKLDIAFSKDKNLSLMRPLKRDVNKLTQRHLGSKIHIMQQ